MDILLGFSKNWLGYKEKLLYSQDCEALEHAALRCGRSPFP